MKKLWKILFGILAVAVVLVVAVPVVATQFVDPNAYKGPQTRDRRPDPFDLFSVARGRGGGHLAR